MTSSPTARTGASYGFSWMSHRHFAYTSGYFSRRGAYNALGFRVVTRAR